MIQVKVDFSKFVSLNSVIFEFAICANARLQLSIGRFLLSRRRRSRRSDWTHIHPVGEMQGCHRYVRFRVARIRNDGVWPLRVRTNATRAASKCGAFSSEEARVSTQRDWLQRMGVEEIAFGYSGSPSIHAAA